MAATPDGRHAKVWDVGSRDARPAAGYRRHLPNPGSRRDAAPARSRSRAQREDLGRASGALERSLSVPGVIDIVVQSGRAVCIALMSKRAGALWDAATGELIVRLHGSGDVFRGPQFSPDGTLLATQAGDGSSVTVWDTGSGSTRRRLRPWGPDGRRRWTVITTAFSADNRQLLTVYDFGELRVWDVASGPAAGRAALPRSSRG